MRMSGWIKPSNGHSTKSRCIIESKVKFSACIDYAENRYALKAAKIRLKN